ncbi:MAG TPA: ABC transporter ATP-binding protein [Chloroflexota bacterium]|nr:ABC transporter ATP-binding protein [Chloroflexota bacterium]
MTADRPRDGSAAGPLHAPDVLRVEGLHTFIATEGGVVRAVDGVSFTLRQGEIFGLVGESGCGKSVTCRTLAGLMPSPPARTIGTVYYAAYGDRNLLTLSQADLQRLRGTHLSMIFQDAMSGLNPVVRIGKQVMEAVGAHQRLSPTQKRERALDLLRLVGIPMPARRMRDYPYQFSGGMRQRVLIAIALASHPKILLADEPTTALDVTIQDQILSLLIRLQGELGMSVILVSHDLGVIAETCARVAVMYAGQIVELADTETLLTRPRHPYTIGLLRSLPGGSDSRYLQPIPGAPPSLIDVPPGCRFAPRCPLVTDRCRSWQTELLDAGPGHGVRCWRHEEAAQTRL